MEGIAETTAAMLKLVSGRLSDRWGRRKPLTAFGYAISTLARPAVALVTAGWQVIALRFVDRIGKGIRTAPRDALLADSAPASARGFAYSFHRAMDHLGAVLGPMAAAGVLFGFLGYGLWHGHPGGPSPAEETALRWAFGLALIPGVAAVAVILIAVREARPPAPDPAPPGSAPPPRVASAEPLAPAGASDGPRSPRRLPGRLHGYVAIVTLFALGNSSDLFLVYYGKARFGLGLAGMIGLWLLLHASKILFSLPGGILSDRWGRTPLLLAGWAVYALVYLGLAHADAAWQLWALLGVYGLYYGLTEGAEKAFVADLVPADQRGSAFGLFHAATGLAALPASLVFGVFWMRLGPATAFGIGAAIAGLATVLLIGFSLWARWAGPGAARI